MSKVGQLTRGMKYSLQRNPDGTLLDGILNDPMKMNDVNIYNNFLQTRQKKKVDSLLIYARRLQRDGLKSKPQYRQTITALNSDEILDQVKIKAIEDAKAEAIAIENKPTRKK